MSFHSTSAKGWLLAFCVSFFAMTATSQVTALFVEPEAIHVDSVGDTDLSGYTTFRIYAQLTSGDDFVQAIFGSDDAPLSIATTTSFWQHPAGGNLASEISPFMASMFPEMAYDSWLTVGLEQAPTGGGGVFSVGMESAFGTFASGGNVQVNASPGGSWFVYPGTAFGLPDADLRVLVAQLTTDGLVSGTLNLQVFVGGDQSDVQQETLTFSAGLAGCTDPMACNYDEAATLSDDSCVFPVDGYDCDGACLLDADSDGVCDPFEIAGCTNVQALNFNAAATDDDGSCITDPSGYCGEGTYWDAAVGQCVGNGGGDGGVGGYGSPCFGDFLGDGSIGATELLMFLTVYDTNCTGE